MQKFSFLHLSKLRSKLYWILWEIINKNNLYGGGGGGLCLTQGFLIVFKVHLFIIPCFLPVQYVLSLWNITAQY